MLTGNQTNIRTYNAVYQSMDHAHAYPNTNLVRLERWFLKKPGKILDHGCGYGENLIFLASRGYTVTGADVSQNLLDYVSFKCAARHVAPTSYDLRLLTGDGPLPFEDDSFDHAISLGVLEMMGSREVAASCVAELARCTRPGGKLIVSTLAPQNTFVMDAKKNGGETLHYTGKERDKETPLTYELYVPDTESSFAGIFPPSCEVHEVGSWDNCYCGVNGRHFVALATKKS